MVQGFSDVAEVDLALPCTYDFDVTGSKYLHSLREGTSRSPYSSPARCSRAGSTGSASSRCRGTARPVTDAGAVWRDMVDLYFPNTGWLRLDRDTSAALANFKAAGASLTWDETVWSLLVRLGRRSS